MKKKNIFIFAIFSLLICISIYITSYGNDIYWHIKSGEWMINNHKIITTNTFSWYLKDINWISHEWLFEIIIYNLFKHFSTSGLYMYMIINTLLISLFIYLYNKNIFNNNSFFALLWAAFGIFAFVQTMIPRPHLLSFLLFTITLYISFREIKKSSKLIYFSPLISIIWANAHGGSSNLSYIIYLMFLLSIIINKNKDLLIKFTYAFFTSIIGIMINPHGIKMIIYPYQNLSYKMMLKCIDEWQTLNILKINGFIISLFIIYLFYKVFKNKKTINLTEVLLLLSFSALTIKSTRFITYLYITSSFIIPKYWVSKNIKINLFAIFIYMIIIHLFINICLYTPPKFKMIADKLIKYLENEKNIKLYNSYNLGGYLILKNIPVFIDGRADIYINDNFCDSCNIEKYKKYNILNNYDFNTFIVINKSNLYNYLKDNDNYTLIITDNTNSIFKKIQSE